jgi:hypothetical protein
LKLNWRSRSLLGLGPGRKRIERRADGQAEGADRSGVDRPNPLVEKCHSLTSSIDDRARVSGAVETALSRL